LYCFIVLANKRSTTSISRANGWSNSTKRVSTFVLICCQYKLIIIYKRQLPTTIVIIVQVGQLNTLKNINNLKDQEFDSRSPFV